MKSNNEDIQFIVVDLFAGAGGVTTGIERAAFNNKKVAKVIAAVNHDPKAILSHRKNHPDTYHFIEDVRHLNFGALAMIIRAAREKYPNAKLALWTSAECTHHSIAKAGPKDEGSRTLPMVIMEYIDVMDPDYIFVENVKEFVDWGPCDDNGYPIKEEKGRTYRHWRDSIMHSGYRYHREFSNAADIGAYTSRIRYFGAFVKPGLPFTFPEITHSKTGGNGLKKHRPVREVLNLESHGKSIFEKKKSDNTYRRIYNGLVKFADPAFLIQYNGQSDSHDLNKPIGTLTTKDRFAKIDVQFMDQQYGTGRAKSIDKPCGALTTQPKQRLVTAQFMDQQYGQSLPKSIDQPINTLTANPKQNLVTAHFLDNPQWGGNGWSVDRPCFTLIARMDKAPPSMVSAIYGKEQPKWAPKPDDTPYERKIKEFMYENGIADVCMRMLEVDEMKDIMGFGKDYKLYGNLTDQKRFIGNAVVCDYPQRWFEAIAADTARRSIKSPELAFEFS